MCLHYRQHNCRVFPCNAPARQRERRHMEGKKISESTSTMLRIMSPQDTNTAGNVQGGVIMRLIDEAGAVVAYRHARTNIVTASVDRIDFLHPVYIGDMVTLKACLNLVGRSSMEVEVQVESENPLTGKTQHTALAFLTYVALDKNGKPTPVPPLILDTDEGKRRNQEAQARREARLRTRPRTSSSRGNLKNGRDSPQITLREP